MVAPVPTANELATKWAVSKRFIISRATNVLAVGLLVIVVGRAFIGGYGLADLVIVGASVALVGPVEWLIHRTLFHAPVPSRRSRLLRTGERHRRHHDDPAELAWLLLDGRGVVLLMLATAALIAALIVASAAAVPGNQPVTRLILTAVILGWLALANYEWTHLLIHSRYRPSGRRYRRLARNHLAHHYRDETTWLGVTTNLGDRLFRTASR